MPKDKDEQQSVYRWRHWVALAVKSVFTTVSREWLDPVFLGFTEGIKPAL